MRITSAAPASHARAARLAQPIGHAAAWILSGLAAFIRPHKESPAEAAYRLSHSTVQPGFTAEVRAVVTKGSGLH
jgi:hypothetical protein